MAYDAPRIEVIGGVTDVTLQPGSADIGADSTTLN